MSPLGNALSFRWNAVAALALHAVLLFRGPLSGGADLTPHVRLMQQMAEAPALRSVYAPAYHVVGALLGAGPLAVAFVGLASIALLLFGFRRFQSATGLPELCAALYAWAPYGFALSWCLPKVEAAGYGVAFLGLAWLWEGRHARLAAALAGAFWVHTGAALFLGLAGGIAALARRDRRALAALALGCALAAPLWWAHLAAGCSFAEALLLSRGDYLRSAAGWSSLDRLDRVVALAGPIAVGCALVGARALWREQRALAWLCIGILVLWTNELWLAPLGTRTTLNLLRGLTLFAVPVSFAAGRALADHPRAARAALLGCVAWALGSTWLALPGSCYREPLDYSRVGRTRVDRCTFRWTVTEVPQR